MALPDQVDVWAVDVSGRWLQGAPDADGGGDASWVVAEQLLEPTRLRHVDTLPR